MKLLIFKDEIRQEEEEKIEQHINFRALRICRL